MTLAYGAVGPILCLISYGLSYKKKFPLFLSVFGTVFILLGWVSWCPSNNGNIFTFSFSANSQKEKECREAIAFYTRRYDTNHFDYESE